MMDGLEDIPHPTPVQPITFPIGPSEVGRILPSREVTRDTIQDAYIQFILFCNPSFPQDSDTTALKETFASPPTSNKKTFDTFEIYLLVKRLHDYDVKTWHQLAILLGVEPPSGEDGGGSQRVQQYVVRLKRWMKVTHIDAFFQYLIGKPHEYYLEIPPLDDPFPSEGRDGVLTNEDLALRALDPRLRPKRGRKRLESSMEELPPAQRHTFTNMPSDDRRALFATPLSAVPRSAFPESAITDPRGHDPWSAMSPWPSQIGMSATEPRSAFSAFAADPRMDQMRTPVMANRLNKWAINATPTTPASNRPLAMSPGQQRRPTPPMRQSFNQPNAPPVAVMTLDTNVQTQPPASENPMSAVSAASTSSRRERQRLQLQVPKHTGGPVRLMTPPAPVPAATKETAEQPVVLESQVSVEVIPESTAPDGAGASALYESLKRNLAADLLRSELIGRQSPVASTEAKHLAIAVLTRLGLPTAAKATSEGVLAASLHLGLAHTVLLFGLSFAPTASSKKLTARQALLDEFGYEISANAATDGPTLDGVKTLFDMVWTTSMGALTTKCELRDLELGSEAGLDAQADMSGDVSELRRLKDLESQSDHIMQQVRNADRTHVALSQVDGGAAEGDDQARFGTPQGKGVEWRERYFELERVNKTMHHALEKARDRMIDVVLSL